MGLYPLAEQQSPNAEPAHVAPPGVLRELHVPSVDTGGPVIASQMPKSLWHPEPQCPLVSPQYPYSEQQSPKAVPRQIVPPLAAPQRPSVERFDVLVGTVELVVDVVVSDTVPDVVPVIVTSYEANTISVVYVDFEISSMVVMNVSVKPGPHGSGVYRPAVSVRVLFSVRVPVSVRLGRLAVSLMSWRLRIGSDALLISSDRFLRMKS
ncbi:uncharacterized protein QC761_0024200 [Podospora bellae-mahoneyi]|uniref:Uncharacterized protein n=1 Tax=Podospora bellae-mahoneyi TaxID=2093777 RepID=A0ABR0G1Y3_9PEZI|nr:hypothetical protein QC761_0024200 [Podospora bellae-mahoneyi]